MGNRHLFSPIPHVLAVKQQYPDSFAAQTGFPVSMNRKSGSFEVAISGLSAADRCDVLRHANSLTIKSISTSKQPGVRQTLTLKCPGYTKAVVVISAFDSVPDTVR